MTNWAIIIAAPLLIAAIVMAFRFVGCSFLVNFNTLNPAPYSPMIMSAAQSAGGDLVSYWQLNNPLQLSSGPPTAPDSADNNNGTYEGPVAIQPGLVADDTWNNIDSNQASFFDGIASYVTVAFPPNSNLNQQTFSVEAIVQLSENPGANASFVVVSTPGYSISLVPTGGGNQGNQFVGTIATSSGPVTATVVADANVGDTCYVMMTYDTSELRLYVNPAATQMDSSGNFIESDFTSDDSTNQMHCYMGAANYQPSTIPTGELRIGADQSASPQQFFNGLIQDVAVYNTAVSFQIIVWHYWIAIAGYEK
jgi:hypothetical protein